MKIQRTLLAGISGAVVMSTVMVVLRAFGLHVSLEEVLGTLVPGVPPFAAGFVLHLVVGVAAAVVYAGIFEFALQTSGPLPGAGVGLSHGLLAGLSMSVIPAMNSLSYYDTSVPGAFLQNVPYGPALFMALHVLFGAVVGIVYGRPMNCQVQAESASAH
jgi:hypothetical protein